MPIKELLKQLKDANGTEFENIFSEIMKRIYNDRFQKTQTRGNKGDLKADAIHLDNKTIYAVHAPEKFDLTKVINKLKSDYEGFIELKKAGRWSAITQWIFVLKSDRKGIPSDIMDFITTLDGEHGISTGIWGMKDIEGMALDWTPPEIPGQTMELLRSSVLQLQRQGKLIIKDFEQNRDRLFDLVEWHLETQEDRKNACNNVMALIQDIYSIFIQYPGTFEDMDLKKSVKKLVNLEPETGISIVTIDDAYDSLCKKNRNGEYILIKHCNKIMKRLEKKTA
ncbi:hypothetical protein [Paenibacillus taichungensis]